jgi:hypothetical protein
VDEAGRLSAGGVELRVPERNVDGAARQVEAAHRLAVQPHVVNVVGEDHDRAPRSDAVEILRTRGAALGPCRVAPLLADDPVPVGMRGSVRLEELADLRERSCVAELHGLRVRAEPHVVVRVDESREDEAALGVDRLLRIGSIGVVADPRDPAIPDRDRLRPRERRVDRVDPRVSNEKVQGGAQ